MKLHQAVKVYRECKETRGQRETRGQALKKGICKFFKLLDRPALKDGKDLSGLLAG